jgi:ubiquinone/menaquinone biosynthesis C-methylase UbiE
MADRRVRDDDRIKATSHNSGARTTGLVLHAAARYDLLLRLAMLGRERAFREKVLSLARLERGESVLDVGCGTGTLAIAAKQHVGPAGVVHGIDASPEMVDRAGRKATKARVDVIFTIAAAQALPFPDAWFDVVLTTIMLHHLPRSARQQCAREIGRVLKPCGRVLAVDFATSSWEERGLLARLHRHGRVDLDEIVTIFGQVGLNVIETGAVGFRSTQFVLATARGTDHESLR